MDSPLESGLQGRRDHVRRASRTKILVRKCTPNSWGTYWTQYDGSPMILAAFVSTFLMRQFITARTRSSLTGRAEMNGGSSHRLVNSLLMILRAALMTGLVVAAGLEGI